MSTSKGMCICTRGGRKIVRPRKLMAQEAPNGPSQRFYGLYTKRRHQTPSVTCPWDAFLSFAQPSAESTNPLCAATIEAEMRSFLSRPAFHPTGGLFELLGCLPEPCICLWLLSQHENVGWFLGVGGEAAIPAATVRVHGGCCGGPTHIVASNG